MVSHAPTAVHFTLDRAVAFGQFGRIQNFLLALAREQVAKALGEWDDRPWAEQIAEAHFALDLDGIARQAHQFQVAHETGITRASLQRAVHRLIVSRVIAPGDGGSLRFNMSLDQWRFPRSGRPRFNSRLLRFCLDALHQESSDLD